MDFLKNLGFDPVMLGAQILNFLIILFLLKRFLYKPVMDMVKKREETIVQGLKDAEQARKTLEKTIEEEKKILSKAQNEAKNILEDAKVQALEVSKEIEEVSKKQNERMFIQAKENIEQEAKETESRLTQKISIIASDLLTKSLEGIFSEKEQKQILDKTLKNINKVN
jgi:F-type H+-transporting ATPase subunit b